MNQNVYYMKVKVLHYNFLVFVSRYMIMFPSVGPFLTEGALVTWNPFAVMPLLKSVVKFVPMAFGLLNGWAAFMSLVGTKMPVVACCAVQGKSRIEMWKALWILMLIPWVLWFGLTVTLGHGRVSDCDCDCAHA